MGAAHLIRTHGSARAGRPLRRADVRRAASSGPWRSPSRTPGPTWPTSPPAPSRSRTAPTGSSAARCGSPAATTSWPRTSSTWCWPAPRARRPGTRGISLFIVPKHLVGPDGSVGERNDVTLAGINHKMGFRGTVNTAPVLGDGAFTPGGRAGRRRLPGRRREPRPAADVRDDERGPRSRSAWAPRHWGTPAT